MYKNCFSQSFLLIGFLAFTGLQSGCVTTSAEINKDGYLASAQKNFDAANKFFADERYDDAIAHFEHVRSKFPYSQFAALSDLRIADAYFIQQKWLLAAEAYDFFLKFHPSHQEAELATFRLAKSHSEAGPSTFFLFPKSYTRDQKTVKDCLLAIETLLERFPQSKFESEALKMKAEKLELLAMHDMRVAQFYSDRKKWQGALSRYEDVAQSYPGSSCAPEALYQSAKIALNYLNDSEKAKSHVDKLKAQYEKSSYTAAADKLLTSAS